MAPSSVELATGPLAEAASHWRADRQRRRAPGGESYEDLAARVAAFRADLPATGRVVAFSHSGTIRTALYGVFGHPDGVAGASRSRTPASPCCG